MRSGDFWIGMAVAEALTGPWRRYGPLLGLRDGALEDMITNPSVAILPNGTALLYYRTTHRERKRTQRHIGVAVADHWAGPYRRLSRVPLFEALAEDPYVWQTGGVFHMLVHDSSSAGCVRVQGLGGRGVQGFGSGEVRPALVVGCRTGGCVWEGCGSRGLSPTKAPHPTTALVLVPCQTGRAVGCRAWLSYGDADALVGRHWQVNASVWEWHSNLDILGRGGILAAGGAGGVGMGAFEHNHAWPGNWIKPQVHEIHRPESNTQRDPLVAHRQVSVDLQKPPVFCRPYSQHIQLLF